MRHSRFAQSYNDSVPSLEVTEAEMLDRRSPKSWTCETIAQLNIPRADLTEIVRSTSPVKSRRSGIVRRSHSIVDAHRLTIHRNVTRRMQAAKERGDEQLLRALEAELRETISA
ncbi:MAG: hypothetical protein KME10_12010 [Plectolyngbya sp. WJT66-NPBG17]|jgi:hypothetical protein|nr:hypothetical protein [Plectolyngbya sp. WJT66-NPBG17]MBW4527189.1 hypothetical protein [Phormidium tanganyikae FI6-MK23]